jgi:hypothetical protein
MKLTTQERIRAINQAAYTPDVVLPTNVRERAQQRVKWNEIK